ncbi:MAG TPA: ABC transporter permease [Polyangiaceae bacterium]|nr:ABC transporter permease [Polyangiaceae bacterium]
MTHFAIIWGRASKSRRATVGVVLLAILALIGIFAELIAAPAPIFALGPRGLSLLPAITTAEAYEDLSPAAIEERHGQGSALWPIIRFGPTTISAAGPHAPSSRAHPLGTDEKGRDLAARLVYGARTALVLSVGAVAIGMLLGVALGGLAGAYRVWNDVLVRLIETVDTFPAIIIVALVRAIEREPSALSLVIAVALVRWAEVARLTRAMVLRASTEDYVLAARALGSTPRRIFWRHMLPNAIGPVVVSSVFGVASVVLLEAAISFLGMGAPTRAASWGETLAEGARSPEHLRLILLPTLALLITMGGSYVLADALRDAMDPRVVRKRKADLGTDSPLSMVWQGRRR